MGVKIITDNCCDLPQDIIDEYDIKMIHMLVRFGVKEYQPDTLSIDEFYKMMVESPELPTTSQPTMEELLHVYEECLADGSEAIAIHLSSGMTGTVQSAQMAWDMLEGKERLTIIDSRKASLGQGLLVLQAARLAKQDVMREQIVEEMFALRERMNCLFTINTLEYLVKGGRVSRTAGLVGSILDIKPVLHVNPEGFIEPLEKVRSRKGALRRLVRLINERSAKLAGQTVGISYVACYEEASIFRDDFLNKYHVKEVIMNPIGPVVGSHVGPGAIAIFFAS
ncbi:MAG: DegV family protein [Syntrophomonadaceae bacterium]|jgi:DegV family protein with EDD domain|nr:DegV family protein [Syntrophomonadaceae bacterium]